MTSPHNLLHEKLLAYTDDKGQTHRCTLPGLLSVLESSDNVESFPQLRAHQEHSWYAFLVQLAALATEDLRDSDRPQDEAAWRTQLEMLTPGVEREAWSLVVEDPTKPAFLQPPVPVEHFDRFHEETSPDSPNIDTLISTRGHAVKSGSMQNAQALDWIYAIVELQTATNFGGAWNYQIMRMNGGYSSRPCVTLISNLSYGMRFKRDVELLRKYAEQTATDFGFDAINGHKLLWLLSWNGSEPLEISQLHPYCIEVARRFRLSWSGNRLVARRGTSSTARIAAKHLNGAVGDPWVPIERTKSAALTVDARGFTYQRLHRLLLTQDFSAPITQHDRRKLGERAYIYCWAVARGQSQTNGLHKRMVPIPGKVRSRLNLYGSEPDRELSELSERRIQRVSDCAKRVVAYPLRLFFRTETQIRERRTTAGPAEKGAVDAAWRDFDRRVDHLFFEQLWDDADLSEEERSQRWDETLIRLARDAFEAAVMRLHVPGVRRYQLEALAWNAFEARVRMFRQYGDETHREVATDV